MKEGHNECQNKHNFDNNFIQYIRSDKTGHWEVIQLIFDFLIIILFMDNLSHFHSLEELIRALDRERKLLHALFQDRKKLSFRYDLARDLASKKV